MRIGVRAQDEGHQQWLRELLAGHVVDDPEVTPNYSVRISDDPRSLHLLYWGGCLVGRCRTKEGLIHALDAHLGGHRLPTPGTVRLSGLALRRGDAVVVLTHVDQSFGAKLVGRLRDLGVVAEVRPWVDVDADTMELAPSPTIGLLAQTPGGRVQAVLLPEAIAELSLADLVLALDRSGTLVLHDGAVVAAAGLLRDNTQSVAEYALSHVASSLREIFDRVDGLAE